MREQTVTQQWILAAGVGGLPWSKEGGGCLQERAATCGSAEALQPESPQAVPSKCCTATPHCHHCHHLPHQPHPPPPLLVSEAGSPSEQLVVPPGPLRLNKQ